MNRFTDKVVLVTGGCHGIGLAMAKRFHDEGAKVIITSFNKTEVDEGIKGMEGRKVDAIISDKIKPEDRKSLHKSILDKYGRLDVLVLNVGVGNHVGRQLKITEQKFDHMFKLNVKSTFFMIVEFLDLLQKSEKANILVNTSTSVSYTHLTLPTNREV